MTCAEARPLLHVFADGELDVVKSVEIETHLTDCKPCSDALEEIGLLHELARVGGAVSSPSPWL